VTAAPAGAAVASRSEAPLPERHVGVETPDGTMETFVAHPDGPGPFGVVIVYQHVGGLSETMRIMARRIAAEGYYCAVPALYYRLGTIVVDPLSPDERVAAIRRIASGSVAGRTAMADTRALLAFVAREAMARPGPKGAVGYGAGGGLALLAAGTFPEQIAAVAAVLGAGFVTDGADSPHRALARIRGPVYCAFAGDDDIIPAAVPPRLVELFREASIDGHVAVHPGVGHGYAFPDRAAYDRVAADRDWAHIFAMLRQRVGPAGTP
jgi:carboxymethylenebutenolidase